MAETPLRILLLAGSAQNPSRIRACLDVLADMCQHMNVLTYLWDLYEDPLPLFTIRPGTGFSQEEVQVFHRLEQQAQQADAFILGTPVYHNSFSGILKNALDSLSICHFQDKPVALVSSGNNDRTSSQPCDQLRAVVRGLHAVSIPTDLVTISSDFQRLHDTYRLVNEDIGNRCLRMIEQLIAYAHLMRMYATLQLQPIKHEIIA
ncbi:NADPH-dependent FMN reductase [Ktedonobacter robiniae]|uniref:FMN-dependent NADPH-azoreductase n=1 Tax=Ktedonobacter robiniae TaxID=2778365 RepID=A0ABQ3V507_9CHLR|nr:NADPH-dependent FMN reductase [Ktedonobacter robiniae]GHO60003.1 FMN-dependent NADPH-azoreductase [Ktedonobacter robiniae]